MSMNDPIADFLTRIRNALAIRRNEVEVPRSNLKRGLAEVLKREGFIHDYLDIEAGPHSLLRIRLKYGPEGQSTIRGIDRVSKPGRRVYRSAVDLESPRNGQGILVLSTDRGVVSDREAKSLNAGGEVLCQIY
jgi:small subunit ribosomal protein S8